MKKGNKKMDEGNKLYLLLLPFGGGCTVLFLIIGIGALLTKAEWNMDELLIFLLFFTISIFMLTVGITSYSKFKKKRSRLKVVDDADDFDWGENYNGMYFYDEKGNRMTEK